MTNSNNGWVNLAVGWLKTNKKGQQFISALGGNKQTGLQLLLRNAKGEEIPIESFIVTFNENKKSEKAPDVSMSLKLE